jgi:hypothetical protein
VDASERHCGWPNLLRIGSLVHNVALVVHWNACALYALRTLFATNTTWKNAQETDTVYNYLQSLSISCRSLLMLDVPPYLDTLQQSGKTRLSHSCNVWLFRNYKIGADIYNCAANVGNIYRCCNYWHRNKYYHKSTSTTKTIPGYILN